MSAALRIAGRSCPTARSASCTSWTGGSPTSASPAPRPSPRAGSCRAWSTPTATSVSTTTGRWRPAEVEEQAVADPRRRRPADPRLRVRRRTPAGCRSATTCRADPLRAPPRGPPALHPRLRPRGRAGRAGGVRRGRGAARRHGWVKLVGDWIDRGERRPRAVVPARPRRRRHRRRPRRGCEGDRALLRSRRPARPDRRRHRLSRARHELRRTSSRRWSPTAPPSCRPSCSSTSSPKHAAAGAERFPDYAAHDGRPLRADARDPHGRARGRCAALRRLRRRGHQPARQPRGEVVALHRIGLSPHDALGAASWRARAWLGHPGLEEGAPADLVVYPADPLADLSVLASPSRVVLRGAPVRVEHRHQDLDDDAQQRQPDPAHRRQHPSDDRPRARRGPARPGPRGPRPRCRSARARRPSVRRRPSPPRKPPASP